MNDREIIKERKIQRQRDRETEREREGIKPNNSQVKLTIKTQKNHEKIMSNKMINWLDQTKSMHNHLETHSKMHTCF